MDIFELAKAKKLFGGGGGKREGTAIPVGEHVDRIYFNTELPVEEMRNYLSQLTYIQTPLLGAPLCALYAKPTSEYTGIYIIAVKISDTEYSIEYITNMPPEYLAEYIPGAPPRASTQSPESSATPI